MRKLRQVPTDLELGLEIELECDDVAVAEEAIAESQGKTSCSCCDELCENVEELHQHQINCHSQTELSLALINLRGFDLQSLEDHRKSPANAHLLVDFRNVPKYVHDSDSESTITVNSEDRMNMMSPSPTCSIIPLRAEIFCPRGANKYYENSTSENDRLSSNNDRLVSRHSSNDKNYNYIMSESRKHSFGFIDMNQFNDATDWNDNFYNEDIEVDKHSLLAHVNDSFDFYLKHREENFPKNAPFYKNCYEKGLQGDRNSSVSFNGSTNELKSYGTHHGMQQNKDALDKDCFKLERLSNNASTKNNSNENFSKPADGRLFFCNKCDRSYKKKSHLARHLRGHSGVRPFICNVCDKRFAVRSILKQHLRVHTGERPFLCEVCHQTFPQKSGLLTHLMLHYGKPFKCDLCDKAFVSNHKLQQHQKSHRSEKHEAQYTCSQCHLSFVTIGALLEHQKKEELVVTEEVTQLVDESCNIVKIENDGYPYISEDAAKAAVAAVETDDGKKISTKHIKSENR